MQESFFSIETNNITTVNKLCISKLSGVMSESYKERDIISSEREGYEPIVYNRNM